MMKVRMFVNLRILSTMLVVVAALIPTACSEDTEGLEPPVDNLISFSVKLDDNNFNTRSSVITDSSLPGLCAPSAVTDVDQESDTSERIGIVADWQTKTNPVVTEERYFNHLLYYNTNSKVWNYYVQGKFTGEDEVKYWKHERMMICTAFYPAKYLLKKGFINKQQISANKMRMAYSTFDNQEDVLIGYNVIDSDTRIDKDGKNTGNMVDLQMGHALCALKFQFKSPETEADDALTKVWLDDEPSMDDQESKNFFGVFAELLYATEMKTEGGKTSYVKNPVWTIKRSLRAQNYIWENTTGLPVTFDAGNDSKVTVPYTSESCTNPEAELFCQNDGYIYVIPQKIPDVLDFCFTTKNGGKDNIIKRKLSTESLKEWLPNHRYVYTITLSKPVITITVDVQPWNEIDSNVNIEI